MFQQRGEIVLGKKGEKEGKNDEDDPRGISYIARRKLVSLLLVRIVFSAYPDALVPPR